MQCTSAGPPVSPTVHIYALPPVIDDGRPACQICRCRTCASDGVLHTKSDDGTFRAARGGFVSLGSWMNDVVRQLAASPHCTSAPPADFYVVPMAFDSGMKGRHDAADVLSYLRRVHPFFNASLQEPEPNHLLFYPNDGGIRPFPYREPPLVSNEETGKPFPPEVDGGSRQRHFVALSLTGNPLRGGQPDKDIVLPPGGYNGIQEEPVPRDCNVGRERFDQRVVWRSLADTPWRPLTAAELAARTIFHWGGSASGGGMPRRVEWGPWGAARYREELVRHHAGRPGWSVHDSNAAKAAAKAAGAVARRAFVDNSAKARESVFCGAPYGMSDGWEGRSSLALRVGCIPVHLKAPGARLPLEPLVAWRRFSVFVSSPEAIATLHERLGNISLAEINAMRCEMACAATSMSYLPAHPLDAPAAALARAPPYVPPATCAVDAVTNATGLAASLIELLDRRKRVPEGSAPPRCRCHAKPRHWHSTYSHSSA